MRTEAVRELSVSTDVKAPAGFTLAFLAEYVRDHSGGTGESTLQMRFVITQLAGLMLERDVTVHVEYVRKDTGPAELFICWDPEAKLFPSFTGHVHADPTGATTCKLTLAGTYHVPGGVVGQLFDAVIGVRIAYGTLERLLGEFRDAAEADYTRRMTYS